MIENGSIVELSNNKKYIITESSVEDDKIYYLALEVDFQTEIPTEKSVFFEHSDEDTLILVKNEDDVEFLKTIFVNKFLDEVMEEE